jgi:putative hydrolase of the HAD superfamily
MTVIAYDFDGTLVDSYSCLADVYNEILDLIDHSYVPDKKLVVDALILLEDISDYMGVSSKSMLWGVLLSNLVADPKKTKELASAYWALRTAKTRVFADAKETLEVLRQLKITLCLVSHVDEDPWGKIERVKKSGLLGYFSEVVIYGPGSQVKTLRDALTSLASKHGYSDIYYVDDKPSNLVRLANMKNLVLVNYLYKPPFPKAYSWSIQLPSNIIRIRNHRDILEIL